MMAAIRRIDASQPWCTSIGFGISKQALRQPGSDKLPQSDGGGIVSIYQQVQCLTHPNTQSLLGNLSHIIYFESEEGVASSSGKLMVTIITSTQHWIKGCHEPFDNHSKANQIKAKMDRNNAKSTQKQNDAQNISKHFWNLGLPSCARRLVVVVVVVVAVVMVGWWWWWWWYSSPSSGGGGGGGGDTRRCRAAGP